MNKIKKIVYSVSLLFIGIITALFLNFVSAWVEPVDTANIVAPLNSGNLGQSKLGSLILNLGGAAYGLIVKSGLVGIGTDAPETKLDVRGETRTDSLGVRGETNLTGNLNANGNISTKNSLCINGDCKNAWPATFNDTLQSVTNRGSTTTTGIQANGGLNVTGNLCLNGDCRNAWPTVYTPPAPIETLTISLSGAKCNTYCYPDNCGMQCCGAWDACIGCMGGYCNICSTTTCLGGGVSGSIAVSCPTGYTIKSVFSLGNYGGCTYGAINEPCHFSGNGIAGSGYSCSGTCSK